MSKVVDVPRLIAEVQKRPALWDGRLKARQLLPKLWQEVAENVGADVKQCKRKWKNLRDAYRAEVRRYLRRLQSEKLMGDYKTHLANYKSKWIYFPYLTFLNESKQLNDYSIDTEINNPSTNDPNHLDDAYNTCSMPEQSIHKVADIKLEPSHYIEFNQNFNEDEDDDDDTANDLLFEEFESIATPKAASRLCATFSINNTSEQTSASTGIPSTATAPKCKCSQNTQEKVQFLQDLGKEEQKLMKFTRQDITRCNKLDHIGDFDYNFLVSFLPQMKKMSELQNLQFRAKMSETVLSLLTDTATQNTSKTCENQSKLPSTLQTAT